MAFILALIVITQQDTSQPVKTTLNPNMFPQLVSNANFAPLSVLRDMLLPCIWEEGIKRTFDLIFD